MIIFNNYSPIISTVSNVSNVNYCKLMCGSLIKKKKKKKKKKKQLFAKDEVNIVK